MANTPQAKKRIRRNDQPRRDQRRAHQPHPQLREEGRNGDRCAATRTPPQALKAAQPELARGVARGVLHKNTAARKMCV